ncbi:hypothetical protein BC834DRAFT_898577 [Gloeopeniophorella convolvens]|nr:hypothetical protein BC834DRAFT_898577 [Gloeopeniophorella convolvens]
METIVQGPPPSLESILGALRRRERLVVALPSTTTRIQNPDGTTTSLTPRETAFASADTLPQTEGKRTLRCRVCAETTTSHNFGRHCESKIRHPTRLYFCKRCWRPFNRLDSCERHVEKQVGTKFCISLSEEAGRKRFRQEMGLLCAYEAFLIPRLLRGEQGLQSYKDWVQEARRATRA